MRIAVTGGSGFVGSAFVRSTAAAHAVVRLVRTPPRGNDEVRWDPATGGVDGAALGSLDGVVHLAGENIAAGRWTKRRKEALRDSRVPTTERLCRTLATLEPRPRVLVSASAIGIYGDRGDTELDEGSAAGDGFLAQLSRDWEAATEPARDAGIRVVRLRLGVVLDPAGGALARMLPAFRLGFGGRLGSGRQWMSWIALSDLLATIQFALTTEALHGPVNAVAPEPVTNREFTATLAKSLRRPALLPAPAPILRLALGEMADAALLASARVRPKALLAAGFAFRFGALGPALATMLAKK